MGAASKRKISKKGGGGCNKACSKEQSKKGKKPAPTNKSKHRGGKKKSNSPPRTPEFGKDVSVEVSDEDAAPSKLIQLDAATTGTTSADSKNKESKKRGGMSLRRKAKTVKDKKTDKEKAEKEKAEKEKKEKEKKEKKKKDDKMGAKPEVAEGIEKFLTHIEKTGWEKILEEFHVGHKEDCTEVNNDTRFVLTTNVPEMCDFYDANKIEFSGVECKFVAASAPDEKEQETFWRMVFDSNVQNLFILENFEKTKKNNSTFWPLGTGEHKDYGCMSVSNMKHTDTERDYQAILEVLPDGCSNSIIVRLVNAKRWSVRILCPWRRMNLHLVRLLREEKGTCMVVCADGKSRCGTFMMLHASLTKLINGTHFVIADLLKEARDQRYGTIQTEDQYGLVYMISVDYLACKQPTVYGSRGKDMLQSLQKMATVKAATEKTDDKKKDEISKKVHKEPEKKNDTPPPTHTPSLPVSSPSPAPPTPVTTPSTPPPSPIVVSSTPPPIVAASTPPAPVPVSAQAPAPVSSRAPPPASSQAPAPVSTQTPPPVSSRAPAASATVTPAALVPPVNRGYSDLTPTQPTVNTAQSEFGKQSGPPPSKEQKKAPVNPYNGSIYLG